MRTRDNFEDDLFAHLFIYAAGQWTNINWAPPTFFSTKETMGGERSTEICMGRKNHITGTQEQQKIGQLSLVPQPRGSYRREKRERCGLRGASVESFGSSTGSCGVIFQIASIALCYIWKLVTRRYLGRNFTMLLAMQTPRSKCPLSAVGSASVS